MPDGWDQLMDSLDQKRKREKRKDLFYNVLKIVIIGGGGAFFTLTPLLALNAFANFVITVIVR